MAEWFESLSTLQQTLFVVAAFSTTVFAVQTLFSLFGIGDVDEPDPQTGTIAEDVGTGSAFGDVFTIRNGMSFLMGLSWGGLMAYDWGWTHIFFVLLVGLFVGTLFVAINMGLLALLSMLRHEGNLRIENAIGQAGVVTLVVPDERKGAGKVSVSVQGRLLENHAVTDGHVLERGASVRVVGLAGGQLIVAGMPEAAPVGGADS